MCNMNKVSSLLFVQFLLFGLAVSAQTVSPIIVECGKKCRGEFSITNNGLTPLPVSVRPRSFSLDTLAHKTNRPRGPGVDLRAEEGSAATSPKGPQAFAYQHRRSVPPCI